MFVTLNVKPSKVSFAKCIISMLNASSSITSKTRLQNKREHCFTVFFARTALVATFVRIPTLRRNFFHSVQRSMELLFELQQSGFTVSERCFSRCRPLKNQPLPCFNKVLVQPHFVFPSMLRVRRGHEE